jgi:hypothetical protein
MGATDILFRKLSSTSRCKSITEPALHVVCGPWWSVLPACDSKGALCCKFWSDVTLPLLLVSSSINCVVVTVLSIAAGAEVTEDGETVTDSNCSCSWNETYIDSD